MATVLRDWSYRYPWLYNAIARATALAVGGERRFRQLALDGLALPPDAPLLDLCCGAGQATRYLLDRSPRVTGLDASPRSLRAARQAVPQAEYVEGFAEDLPFGDGQFRLVHVSVALHEMQPAQRRQILREAQRVLQPGGVLAIADFHRPNNPLAMAGLAAFAWIFETETTWKFLDADLIAELKAAGFDRCDRALHGLGSLQTVQAWKPA